ncbi:MAG: cupin domain-containing protein, partial [Gloeomargarita sp. DG_2_bins_126]
GYYREIYRSPLVVTLDHCSYNACTHIYWLLTQGDFSAWHRVRQGDEIWHWYGGDPLELHTLSPDYSCQVLGAEHPCMVVPAGVWQAAQLVAGGDWVWCGCTVSPGFSFARFDLGERARLIQEFPAQADVITRLTRM